MNFITQWLVGAVLEEQRAERIDVAKAAVLREMAALSDRMAEMAPHAKPGRDYITKASAAVASAEWHRCDDRAKSLARLLNDEGALLAYHERKAGALSEPTAGDELSEVER